MSFTWGEISKWAKAQGYKVSKKNSLFFWSNIDDQSICGEENSFEDMIKAVFNRITENKWIEHQKNYKAD